MYISKQDLEQKYGPFNVRNDLMKLKKRLKGNIARLEENGLVKEAKKIGDEVDAIDRILTRKESVD